MSTTDILYKAVKKAFPDKKIEVVGMSISMNGAWLSYREVIYWHDFAKNLWGYEYWSVDPTGWHKETDISSTEEQAWFLQAWEYHLQQMVIADDPVRYLGENI